MKLGTVIPCLKKSQRNANHVTRSLCCADICILSSEISKFCFTKKYRYRLHFGTSNVEKKYLLQGHHLIKYTIVIVLEKLTAREIYSVLILSSGNTPTSQKYIGKVFPNENFDWKKIYILPRVVTINRFQRNFQ